MVVTEEHWKKIDALKLDKRAKERQNRTTNLPTFPKEENVDKDERIAKNLMQRKHDTSGDKDKSKGVKNSNVADKSKSKGKQPQSISRVNKREESKKQNDSGENGSNVEKALLAMLGGK